LRGLYYAYLALGVALLGLSWMVPVAVAGFLTLPTSQAGLLAGSMFLPAAGVALITAWWIPRYYASLRYLLSEQEIVVEHGVYWRRKSFVPYNRVTNVDMVQGPLARAFNLGTVRIQTAGYSSGSSGTHLAEAVILGVKDFEGLKDAILTQVRRLRPVGVEAAAESAAPRGVSEAILEELRRTRKALEKP
jgi:membrane protein YdbS with pleckstrin-like domain